MVIRTLNHCATACGGHGEVLVRALQGEHTPVLESCLQMDPWLSRPPGMMVSAAEALCFKRTWCHRPPTVRRWRQKNQNFKIIPGYPASLRPQPGLREPCLKTQTNKTKYIKYPVLGNPRVMADRGVGIKARSFWPFYGPF